ncbi:MAG: DUF3500 domain-containing protein [Fimbriiglobus sp.]
MKSFPLRLLLASVAFTGMAAAALVARQAPPPAAAMATAAQKCLATLPPDLKTKAAFGFDDPHREKWYFTPQQNKQKQFTRKGVRLEELDDTQKAAAFDLLKSGLSGRGFEQASTIISLESLLADLEGGKGAMTRNPAWYFVSVFGDPTNTGPWGWRIEGHHLSVNFTLDKGRVVSSSPVLFGVNPAEVKSGPKKGLRATPEIVDVAKELIASLTDEQRAVARQTKPFPEIQEGRPDANVGTPVGLPAGKLAPAQQAILTKLVEAYAGRLTAEVATAELARIRDAGPDQVHFAYSIDEDKPGKPNTYRVHGPTFVVEFLNEQKDGAGNPANHIHSGWRRLPHDFTVAPR